LGVVRFEIPLVDAPAAPRRDIAIIGLYRVLLESPISGEVTSVLSKYSFVEVLERRLSVDAIGNDSRPVIATAVAGGPLGEPLKLTRCVPSIVPAVATATLPLVLEIPFEGARKRPISAFSCCHESSFAY
jgi:hypothetical protein